MVTITTINLANRVQLQDGATLYYAGTPPLPNTIQASASCLNTATWSDHMQPFAIACVHANTKEVVLVRDHLGIEPLYYCNHQNKHLIVAQNIPDILKQLPSTPPLLKHQVHMLFSNHKAYSDETLYQGIYRVEPGHLMHFKQDGTVIKKAFWKLNAHGEILQYKHQGDYFEHFSSLMDEAILNSTQNQTNLAAEFSAGLDSSAIYCAAAKHQLSPTLYMHVSQPDTFAAKSYIDTYEKAFIEHFQLRNIQRIDAKGFDPIEVLNKYATWFAGPAPYLFSMFASPLHKAVSNGKHPILLSGFGGDQCVSGQLPLNFVLPELIHQGQYRKAWQALGRTNNLKKIMRYAQYSHPTLHAGAIHSKITKRRIANLFRSKGNHKISTLHPYEYMYYPHAREAECALIQGHESHEVRMRIEDSSIIGKKLGFEYRYPLLYPKLLEFIVSLPTQQKRYDGYGRYLIRQYLATEIPDNIFQTYQKKHGLGIIPSTFDLFQKKLHQRKIPATLSRFTLPTFNQKQSTTNRTKAHHQKLYA